MINRTLTALYTQYPLLNLLVFIILPYTVLNFSTSTVTCLQILIEYLLKYTIFSNNTKQSQRAQ